MNKKILIVNPSLIITKEFLDNPHVSFISNLYLACAFKSAGFEVNFIDSFINCGVKQSSDALFFGSDYNKLIECINESFSDILIINYPDYQRSKYLINPLLKKILFKIDKKRHKRIILYDSLLSDTSIFSCYDLLEAKKLSKIQVIKGSFNSLFENLSLSNGFSYDYSLDFSLFDATKYSNFLFMLNKNKLISEDICSQPSFPLFSSIGCNFNCNFCTCKNEWQSLPLDSVIKNINSLYTKGITNILFLDSAMNLDMQRFTQILDVLIKNDMYAYFVNGLRIDFLNDEIIKKLSKVCKLLQVSVESGNQEFLNKNIKKGINLNLVVDNFSKIHDNKLNCFAHYIIGFYDESLELINNTLSFAKDMYNKYQVYPQIQFFVNNNQNNIFRNNLNTISYKEFSQLPQDNPDTIQKRKVSKDKLIKIRKQFYQQIK